MTTEVRLFVNAGCRSCTHIQNLLKSISGWEKIVKISNFTNISESAEITKYASKYKIFITPTLIIIKNGKLFLKLEANEYMMKSEFWEKLVTNVNNESI